jgi:hypothetical protein
MRVASIVCVVCIVVASALADGKKPSPTQYFEGPVTFSSADGKTPMGKGSSLVKRTVRENSRNGHAARPQARGSGGRIHHDDDPSWQDPGVRRDR